MAAGPKNTVPSIIQPERMKKPSFLPCSDYFQSYGGRLLARRDRDRHRSAFLRYGRSSCIGQHKEGAVRHDLYASTKRNHELVAATVCILAGNVRCFAYSASPRR